MLSLCGIGRLRLSEEADHVMAVSRGCFKYPFFPLLPYLKYAPKDLNRFQFQNKVLTMAI